MARQAALSIAAVLIFALACSSHAQKVDVAGKVFNGAKAVDSSKEGKGLLRTRSYSNSTHSPLFGQAGNRLCQKRVAFSLECCCVVRSAQGADQQDWQCCVWPEGQAGASPQDSRRPQGRCAGRTAGATAGHHRCGCMYNSPPPLCLCSALGMLPGLSICSMPCACWIATAKSQAAAGLDPAPTAAPAAPTASGAAAETVLNTVSAVREAAQVSLNSFFGLLLDNSRVSHHVDTDNDVMCVMYLCVQPSDTA